MKIQPWRLNPAQWIGRHVLAGALVCSLSPPSYGAFTLQDSERVRIDLGEDQTIPGEQVTVPCFLETTSEARVGRIEMEVSFPPARVTFEGIRRGLISDQIEAEIISEVTVSPENPELSIVRVSLTPRSQPDIPAGFLFDLVFLISPEMTVDAPPILLGNRARAYRPGSGGEAIRSVESWGGSISVSSEPPPVASCFFYMH